MTPEELTAAAAHSREAMTAIRHIAQHGGVGGMTYVMTSAEDVPGLLAHIEELEHAVERLAGVPLADASPQFREWLANTKPPVGPGVVDTPAALRQRIDAAVPGAVTELEAKVAALRDRDKVLTGRLVEAWHDGHGGDAPLCNYLGLTWEQYQERFGPPTEGGAPC